MGNCTVRGTAVGCSSSSTARGGTPRAALVRVVVGNTGRVVEFDGPVPAGDVLVGFPRHGVFRAGDPSSYPLLRHEQLQNGKLYYLLPLQDQSRRRRRASSSTETAAAGAVGEHVRSLEVLPPQVNGVWRVKLAIDAERLAGILSEQGDAEALIERMRMLALAVDTIPNKHGAGAAWWKAAAPFPVAASNVSSTLLCPHPP